MYGHDNLTDPYCYNSITGYLVTFENFLVLWQSKLHTNMDMSEKDSEVIALAHICIELFPIMGIAAYLSEAVGLPMVDTTMNFSTHEDNADALVLEDTLPPQSTSYNKHYETKNIWFSEDIVKPSIKLFKIDMFEQLWGLFTKEIPFTTFEYLRKKLMGW